MRLSLKAVKIDVCKLPPVLEPDSLPIGRTFPIWPGVDVGEDGVEVDESKAEKAGVDHRTRHGAHQIQLRNPSLKNLSPSDKLIGWGSGGNVVSAKLESKDVVCKRLNVKDAKKQTPAQNELRMHLLVASDPVHPHICAATHMRYDSSGIVTIVMRRLDISIKDMCEHCESRLDLRGVLLIVLSLVDALHYMHDTLEIVHRDVTPSNVFLSYDENKVQLIDFGSAQLYSVLPQSAQLVHGKSLDPYSLPLYAPDTDKNKFGTFQNKRLDDISGLLSILELIYSCKVASTMPTLDDKCANIHTFLVSISAAYKDTECEIPTSAALYAKTGQFVNEDITRIDYPGWTSYLQACLRAKACKSSSQR